MIFRKVTDLIGNTPVIQLPLAQSESRLYIKVEKTIRREHERSHGQKYDCCGAEIRADPTVRDNC